jgi:hypothetical protein
MGRLGRVEGDVGELIVDEFGGQDIAPPGQEGWLCHEVNIAKHPLSAQTGWWFKLEQNI